MTGSVGARRGVNAELIGLNPNGVFGECQWVKHQLSALEKVGLLDMKAESEGFDAIFVSDQWESGCLCHPEGSRCDRNPQNR